MIIYLLIFLSVSPLSLGFLTVNDLVFLFCSPIALVSLFIFKSKHYAYIFYSSNSFNIILLATFSLLAISSVHFITSLGVEPFADSFIRFVRAASFAFYLLGALFIARLILPDPSKSYQCNTKRILGLIYAFVALSASSFIFSLFTSCPGATYGAKYCIIGTSSYSANGYIAVFSIYSLSLLSVLHSHLNRSSPTLSIPIILNIFIPLSYLAFIVIAVNSGSRGAILSLLCGVLSIGFFFVWRTLFSFRFRFTSKSILSSSILLLIFGFLTSFGYRSLRFLNALFYSNSTIASSLQSGRYERTDKLSEVNMLFGNGNFSLSKISTGSSFFDGTFQYFYTSFGIFGLFILFAFIISAVSGLYVCFKKFRKLGKSSSKVLTYALPFASIVTAIVSSFPNELGTLNTVAPFYFLLLFLSGYSIKYVL